MVPTHTPARRLERPALLRDTRGGSFIEYLIILGVVAIAAITGFRAFGRSLMGISSGQGEGVTAAIEGQGSCVGGLCLNGACFVAGTPVATPQGPRPIERLRAGDKVLSRDEATGKSGPRRVTRTFVTRDEPLVDVRLDDADTLRATPGHLFWTADRGWVEAQRLESGEPLLAAGGASLHVAGVAPVAKHATVYNVEVEGTHTYFVGRDAAWVHNADESCAGGNGAAGGAGSAGSGQDLPIAGGTGGASSGAANPAGSGAGVTANPAGFTFVTGTGQVLTGAQAQQAAQLRAAVQAQVPGLPRSSVVVAGVMDTATGKIYYGVNNNDDRQPPSPLHPALAPAVEAMRNDPQHRSSPGSHAEIYALNAALYARDNAAGKVSTAADLQTMMVDTAWLRGNNPGGMNRGDPAPFCGNCQYVPGVINLPGVADARPPTP